MFLDEKGDADPKKSREPALGVGVPGTVAGLALAHAEVRLRASSRSRELIAPAIRLAREGFAVDDDLANSLPRARQRSRAGLRRAKIFFKRDGAMLGRGDTLVQTDLAASLRAIAASGPRAFYEGADRREDRRRAAGAAAAS